MTTSETRMSQRIPGEETRLRSALAAMARTVAARSAALRGWTALVVTVGCIFALALRWRGGPLSVFVDAPVDFSQIAVQIALVTGVFLAWSLSRGARDRSAAANVAFRIGSVFLIVFIGLFIVSMIVQIAP